MARFLALAALVTLCTSCSARLVDIPFIAAFIPPPVSMADARELARVYLGDATIWSLTVRPSTNQVAYAEHGLGQEHAARAPDYRVYVAVADGRFQGDGPDRGPFGRAVLLVDAESGGIRASKYEHPVESLGD